MAGKWKCKSCKDEGTDEKKYSVEEQKKLLTNQEFVMRLYEIQRTKNWQEW